MEDEGPDPGFRDADRSVSFEDLLESLDAFAAWPAILEAQRILLRTLHPRPGMRLLDAGCGIGEEVALMAPRVAPGGHVIGLELSRRMLDLAMSRHPAIDNVTFVQGSIESIHYPVGFFDAAWSMRTVQYLDDPLSGIRELARVTRPGGLVVLIEGGLSAADLPDVALTRQIFGPRLGMGMRLPRLLQDAGLHQVTVEPAFAFDVGRPPAQLMEYARGAAAAAVAAGVADADEAGAWFAEVEAIAGAGRWFSADCLFVVGGTVSEGTAA